MVIRGEKQHVEKVNEETGQSSNKSKPGPIIKKMTLCTGETPFLFIETLFVLIRFFSSKDSVSCSWSPTPRWQLEG